MFLGDYASPQTFARLEGLPAGRESAVTTLRHMRRYVRQALIDPKQQIRELALSIVEPLQERNYKSEMVALHAFVRDAIRYVRDPVGFELVATPQKTLQYKQGDCDDKATLLAALLMSIGHPSRFVAVGFRNQGLSHVYLESKIGNDWIPLETILQVNAGWQPQNVTSRYIQNI